MAWMPLLTESQCANVVSAEIVTEGRNIHAIDIAKGLGDAHGVQLLPQSKLYATSLAGNQLARGREIAWPNGWKPVP
jgi:hypothetical protein